MERSVFLKPQQKKDRPFLGVAISGGGSRAANFGLFVLKELDRLGVLDRVDAISSVSGGSIVAAHFGLYYPKLGDDYWERARVDLSQDFRDDWVARHINPLSWQTLYKNDFNASTLLAETYDAKLFHGATYRDMALPGPGRPHILMNTTIAGGPELLTNCVAQGKNAFSQKLSTFVFSDESFRFCLRSDLSSFSIAQAVAASSAYPLVFSPVTLNVYPQTIDGVSTTPIQYLHLMDGGVSDNLGVDALVSAANERWHQNMRNDSLEDTPAPLDRVPCFLIVVDAFINDGEKLEEEYPDLRRSLADRVVDPSWNYAFDALLQRRRSDSLLNLGIDLENRSHYGDYDRATPAHVIPLRGERGYIQKRYGNLVMLEPNSNDLTCAVWHISLGEVFELDMDYDGIHADSTKIMMRGTIYAVTSNAKTDLKLTGGRSCSAATYQEALSDSAKILVREDANGLNVLHTWMQQHGIEKGDHWQADIPGTNGRWFDVTAIGNGPSGKPSGLIRCRE